MAQLSKEEIRRDLEEAGLPVSEILGTTLPLHKCPEIRAFIQARNYSTPKGMVGVYIHPARPNNAVRARLAFYLAAKEMYLSGISVSCLSLVKLAMLLDHNDEESLDLVQSANMVFLLDFYEHGVAPPLHPWQAGWVRAWIKERLADGHGISLLGDLPLQATSAWWPGSLLSQIAQRTQLFMVTG